jgi:hypothetical protein
MIYLWHLTFCGFPRFSVTPLLTFHPRGRGTITTGGHVGTKGALALPVTG